MARRPKPKPRIFLGSSKESVDIVRAFSKALQSNFEVTPWYSANFPLSTIPLDGVIYQVGNQDFAAFVFAPDDIVTFRGKKYFAVRDNVVLEMGMFLAKLGPKRTFIITPRRIQGLKIPSDLDGVTTAHYDDERSDVNLDAAVDTACTEIIRAMRRAGPLTKNRTTPSRKKPVPRPSSKTVYRTVPITAIATHDIRGVYSDPPLGINTWVGVEFNLRDERFDAIELASGGSERLSVNPPAANVRAVHFLINAGDGRKTHGERLIGRIRLVFVGDNSPQEENLVLGQNVREWAIGNLPGGLVDTVKSSDSHQVWQGRNTSQNEAVIDELKVKVHSAKRGRKLAAIEFTRDIPSNDPTSRYLSYFVSGITIEYNSAARAKA